MTNGINTARAVRAFLLPGVLTGLSMALVACVGDLATVPSAPDGSVEGGASPDGSVPPADGGAKQDASDANTNDANIPDATIAPDAGSPDASADGGADAGVLDRSCADAKAHFGTATDGTFWIDPD